MKIVIAPNALKGSVSAVGAAECIKAGLIESGLEADYDLMPIADGGDDTMDVLVADGGTVKSLTVQGPLGRSMTADYGLLKDGKTAVVEMARASGLKLLTAAERNPLVTTTWGTGQLIEAAARDGAKRIIVGVGGSATVDGGQGCAQALGVKILDAAGQPIAPGGGSLTKAVKVDLSAKSPLLDGVEILIASDVDNPLLGPTGAAAVFGPQKGADPEMVIELEANLAHLYGLMAEEHGIDVRQAPGAGAAGGLGAGLMAFFGAEYRSGIELVLDSLEAEKRLAGADLVVTGEGQMDTQTLHGKGPMGVARMAKDRNIPCFALVGSVGGGEKELHTEGMTAIYSIVPGPIALEAAMADGGNLLAAAAARLGRTIKGLAKG